MTEYRVHQLGDLAIIDLHGKLDAFAGDLWDRACARIGPEVKAILLNLGGVDYTSIFPDEAAALAGCLESKYQV